MTRHRESDRRREERKAATGMRALVRPGFRWIVIDLTSCGALLESGRQLRPGSHVDLHLETDGRRGTIHASVLRCDVAAIDADTGVRYRAALAFKEACEWVREALTQSGYPVPGDTATNAPAVHHLGKALPGESTLVFAGDAE